MTTTTPSGAQFEILVDGKPQSYGDVKDVAIASAELIRLRPDHTADEQVEAVAELTQSALHSLGLKPGMIKPL
jgi:hypothetical protein